ncbi:MAG: helix-turn-helix transcriptional regulator [Paludibacteraceae bacterium]|nr:helix-turn-helix transcriptional regulator [Paludibacteraceae bacterium]
MKKHPITPIQQVVCKNVKALLVERKISVRELSININKDHSQLNKILNNQAILPAYLIDDFATFFEVDRRHLITDKKNILDTDDTQNLIIIRMQIPAYNMYNQIKKWIRTFVH